MEIMLVNKSDLGMLVLWYSLTLVSVGEVSCEWLLIVEVFIDDAEAVDGGVELNFPKFSKR